MGMVAVDAPHRKLKWGWKLVKVGKTWVGVDTGVAVPLVLEAIQGGKIPGLSGYERQVTEVKYGQEGRSRIDILLSRGGQVAEKPALKRAPWEGDERVYVEVKNTTYAYTSEDGICTAAFPDAVTQRGLKHLHELMHVVDLGHRAAMVYCAQRSDVTQFAPADDIDPAYGKGLREALAHGVEAYVMKARVGLSQVSLTELLPMVL